MKFFEMYYVIWVLSQKEFDFKKRFIEEIDNSLYSRIMLVSRIERQNHRGTYIDKEKVMFPGYLFVETDFPKKLHMQLCKEQDYIKILGSDEGFTALTPKEVDFLNRITGQSEKVTMSMGIIEDGTVKILNGPLTGYEQFIKKVDRHKKKAYLEMELFGEIKQICAGLEIVAKS